MCRGALRRTRALGHGGAARRLLVPALFACASRATAQHERRGGYRTEPRVAITFAPSSAVRLRSMRSWLAQGGSSWCIAELDPVHQDDFTVTANSNRSKDVFVNGTHFVHMPPSTMAGRHDPLEGHRLSNAYSHWRALKCFATSSCHPCFGQPSPWLLVAEDDVLPRSLRAAEIPLVIDKALRQVEKRRLHVNKIALVSYPSGSASASDQAKSNYNETRNSSSWIRKKCPSSLLSGRVALADGRNETFHLRTCRMKGSDSDSHAYLVHRDFARLIVASMRQKLRAGGGGCFPDVWRGSDARGADAQRSWDWVRCPRDPQFFRSAFGTSGTHCTVEPTAPRLQPGMLKCACDENKTRLDGTGMKIRADLTKAYCRGASLGTSAAPGLLRHGLLDHWHPPGWIAKPRGGRRSRAHKL